MYELRLIILRAAAAGISLVRRLSHWSVKYKLLRAYQGAAFPPQDRSSSAACAELSAGRNWSLKLKKASVLAQKDQSSTERTTMAEKESKNRKPKAENSEKIKDKPRKSQKQQTAAKVFGLLASDKAVDAKLSSLFAAQVC